MPNNVVKWHETGDWLDVLPKLIVRSQPGPPAPPLAPQAVALKVQNAAGADEAEPMDVTDAVAEPQGQTKADRA